MSVGCREASKARRFSLTVGTHRILKSDCKVRELENRSADRLARAVAINLVIAWRIHLMTLFGRNHPDVLPDIVFSELKIKMLKAFAARQHYAISIPWPPCQRWCGPADISVAPKDHLGEPR